MKRTFIILSMIFLGQTAFAQFGVRLGLNFANMQQVVKYEDETDRLKPNTLIGPMLTFYYDAAIDDNSSVEIGLGYMQRGYKYNVLNDLLLKEKLNYLYFPVTYKYGYEISDGIKLFGRGGLYFGFGLSGKSILSDDESTETEKIKFGTNNKKDDYKPLDFGMELGVGLMFNNFEFGLGYDLGLANIALQSYDDIKYISKNKGFFIHFGMRF